MRVALVLLAACFGAIGAVAAPVECHEILYSADFMIKS